MSRLQNTRAGSKRVGRSPRIGNESNSFSDGEDSTLHYRARTVLSALSIIFLIGLNPVGADLAAQSKPPTALGSNSALSVSDLEFLLQAGIAERDILKTLDARGWAKDKLNQADLNRLEKAGAPSALRTRALARLDVGSNRRERLAAFLPYRVRMGPRERLSFLAPKGYGMKTKQGGRRVELAGPGRQVWFGQRRYFLWALDCGHWRARDEKALIEIVARSALGKLRKGGLVMSGLEFRSIRDPESGLRFVHADALGRDPDTGRSGIFALSLRIDEEAQRILVAGFVKPTPKPGSDEKNDSASILALIMGSARFEGSGRKRATSRPS